MVPNISDISVRKVGNFPTTIAFSSEKLGTGQNICNNWRTHVLNHLICFENSITKSN